MKVAAETDSFSQMCEQACKKDPKTGGNPDILPPWLK
jgi:hypothetical protein